MYADTSSHRLAPDCTPEPYFYKYLCLCLYSSKIIIGKKLVSIANKQPSETLLIALLLSMSAGLMDAYSYLYRGEVFANAQTGNLLLFGVYLAKLNFAGALRYFIPVSAFASGIILTEIVQYRMKHYQLLHWRQLTIFIEALILVTVAQIPQSHNLLANSLISFVCGIQVESFREFEGSSATTTMCIGNLRSGIQFFNSYLHTHDNVQLKKSSIYAAIILFFIIGAVFGSYMLNFLASQTIICSSCILLVVFALMRNKKR